MWIVRLALRRPYSIAVLAILIALLGALSIRGMIVDVFPVIDIPVVAVVWNYPGLSAEDMERRVTFISERAFSTTVGGIERIESQSIPGIGLLRVYFQPGTDLGAAIAQMASVTNTITRILPPGITPPNIIQFNASNVPVAQLTASSRRLSEEQIFDYGVNFMRIRLFTVPGLSTPAPFGGRQRQVNVDVDPRALAARGLSTTDVVNALQSSNIIIPAGGARMGTTDYAVFLNSSPATIDQFRQIPVRLSGGVPVLLGDVARISDGFADQTNIVRVNGRRATYLAILRKSDASTLAVVDATRELLPTIRAAAPEGLELKIDFDQSVFVRGAIEGVLREGALASALVSIMILLFLGSWRSVILVCTSIPLAILVAVIGLRASGHTLNIMTLGGLSLAIGMLVDDATVEVENIHRNRALGKPLTIAILDGAQQVATPAIVATLAICIVFCPVALLQGPARYLFVPLALGVVYAMLTSYVLSRTLVPTLARKLMASEHHGPPADGAGPWARFGWAFDLRREAFLDGLRDRYARILEACLAHRAAVLVAGAAVVVVSGVLGLYVGTDFFPQVDTGLMKLHVRAPAGTRIEETERLVEAVEQEIRQTIPAGELDALNDMIGVPVAFNLAFIPTDNVSGMDAEIRIGLKHHHHPTAGYMRALRERLPRSFPGTSFYFQPADIISQVINFGVSAPVDVQIESRDLGRAAEYAARIQDGLRRIPGVVDVHQLQTLDYPSLQVNVDRERAAQVGLSQRDVANNLLVGLSSSALVAPSYFINPTNNVNYPVIVHVPMRRVESVDNLLALPMTAPSPLAVPGDAAQITAEPAAPAPTLGSVARVVPRTTPNQVSHYTVQRVLDVTAGVEGRDLGSVTADIDRVIAGLGRLPQGMRIAVRGQGEVMRASFASLGLGLVLAIALVYLLMVVLFQSWIDPVIIIMAVPGALVGILWMLAATRTTLNVESMMGAIMAVGIAVANSILMVSFANDVRAETGMPALAAALEAGRTRLRPVIMTALAMVLGMLPMAMGLGEAGEQNAPLGRAVIGGLLVATVTTLFVVPVVYSLLRTAPPRAHELDVQFAREAGEHAAEEGGA